jgi:hypothetical protein
MDYNFKGYKGFFMKSSVSADSLGCPMKLRLGRMKKPFSKKGSSRAILCLDEIFGGLLMQISQESLVEEPCPRSQNRGEEGRPVSCSR